MTKSPWPVVLMAVALALPFSGCASKDKPSRTEVAEAKVDDLKVDVRSVVTDPARADRLVALLDESVALLTEHSNDLLSQDAQITALITNYGTTAEDLRSAFARFSSSRAERSSRGIALLVQMRAATTPEEWAELRKIRQKTLQAVMHAARPN